MNLPLPNPELATSLGRRAFLRRSGLAAFTAAMAPVAANTLFNSTTAEGAALADVDILNFALNLEYLEAEFYANAVFGKGIAALGIKIDGTGTSGVTTVKANPKVNFTSQIIADYAEEIAVDEISHVKFLRNALGSSRIAKPAIDIENSFNALAAATGINGGTFDPYLNDTTFLLGGFIFEDVGVTAYHGAAPFITNKAYLSAAASILSVEGYHASMLRASLYGLNFEDPTQFIADAVNKISQFRDSVDGPLDLDQGITYADGTSNIVPTNGSSIAFSRTPRQVLNIVYAAPGATKGGFFPNGVNGNIK